MFNNISTIAVIVLCYNKEEVLPETSKKLSDKIFFYETSIENFI